MMGSLRKTFTCHSKPERLLKSCRVLTCHKLGGKEGVRYYYGLGRLPLDCRPVPKLLNTHLHVDQRRSVSRGTYFHYLSPDVAPIGLAIQVLESVHTVTGMPWWSTIALTTIALRTFVTLPLYIYSRHNEAKLENLNATFDDIAKQLAMEIKMAAKMKQYEHWDEKEKKRQFKINMKKHVREEYVKHNVHPAKSVVVGIVQIPLWISMTFALRNMTGTIPVSGMVLPVMYPDLATQGLLWFPNLLLPDTTLILPLIMSVSNLLIIEMYRLKKEKPSKTQKIMTYALRGVAVIMLPIAASVPTSISLYWTCSSLYGLIQNIVFRAPRVRRAFGIPEVPNESQRPFQYMWDIAKEKYSMRKVPKKKTREEK